MVRCNMQVMSKKRPTKKYPSREKVSYVGIPRELKEALEEEAKKDERSTSWMARKAIKEFLSRRVKPDPPESGN